MTGIDFIKLNDQQRNKFIDWARENFKAGEEIDPTWQPVIQQECREINFEEELLLSIDKYISEREEHLTLYPEHFEFYYEKLSADRKSAEEFIKEYKQRI